MSSPRIFLSTALLAALPLLNPGAALAADPPGARAAAAQPHPAKPSFPRMELAETKSQGQRAIDLLGARLPEVAAWYGKSPAEFRALLLNDLRLKIDGRGRLLVEDELETPLPAGSTTPANGASAASSSALAPLDQTFLLHSRPGANRTIYLNFKGAVLTNTAWNGGTPTITALPYDFDGFPYAFSAAELERIQYIWQRVVEDYAPFDVNVTTEAPPSDLLTRSGSADQIFGTTVLITSRANVYSCSCGGVAYIGVFDDTSDYYKPALVFYDGLGNGHEKYVAEAISHEAGHNLGLYHDGYSGGGYYQGHGSGATGWAPIMGVGYYKELVQWSKGEYATANNVQDDYVVAGLNGLPIRLDDHGDALGAATSMAGTTANGVTTLSAGGVVERPGDIDMFRFTSGPGTLNINAAPALRSPNLDLRIELRDGNGALLASANPAESLPAALSYTGATLTSYYVSVQGVGKGDPLTTGYTDYGSVGQYALSAVVPVASGQPPVATLTAAPTSGDIPLTVSFAGGASSDPDGSIVAHEWTFGDGNSAQGASVSHVYTAAGSYTAMLKVTDNSGLTATTAVQINATAPVVVLPMGVADIAMSLVSKGRNASATAAVAVRDVDGRPVVGATVDGKWSGLVTGNASAVTDANGVAALASPNTKKSGTFVLTVTGVARAGFSYLPSLNVETSDSITR